MSLNTEWLQAALLAKPKRSSACTHDCGQGRRCTCAPRRSVSKDQWLALAQYLMLVVFVLSLTAAAAGFFQ